MFNSKANGKWELFPDNILKTSVLANDKEINRGENVRKGLTSN